MYKTFFTITFFVFISSIIYSNDIDYEALLEQRQQIESYIKYNELQQLEEMLKKGADINTRISESDQRYWSLSDKFERRLVEEAAQDHKYYKYRYHEFRESTGLITLLRAPLQKAVEVGNINAVRLLIRYGADQNATFALTLQSLLVIAIEFYKKSTESYDLAGMVEALFSKPGMIIYSHELNELEHFYSLYRDKTDQFSGTIDLLKRRGLIRYN